MNEKGWLARLKGKFGGGEEGEKRLGTFQKLMLLAGLGAVVMIFSSFTSVQKEAKSTGIQNPPPADQAAFSNKEKSGNSEISNYEAMYEDELKKILEQIVGVGEVSVMVTLESSDEVVVEKDVNAKNQTTKEMDNQKATRDITETSRDEKVVLVQDGSGQHPVIVKKLTPQVRGVLVVAKGAENLKVKALLLDAVEKALHVEPHKISILPKKG